MKFLEKVKNMFTEEVEDDDVKVEPIQKEVTHVSIKSPVAAEEEHNVEEDLSYERYRREKEEKKPIFFDDNDFKDLNLIDDEDEKPINKHQAFESNEKIEKKEEEKKVFKPTPIISPVYGVLDKNYHKEDIVSRTDRKPDKELKESPIDTIRNKAYGTLEDELENTLFGSNSVLFKNVDTEDKKEEETKITEVDEDVLTNLTDDISKELDELLIKKEKYIEEDKDNNDDKPVESNPEKDEDLLGFIDSTLYKNGDE